MSSDKGKVEVAKQRGFFMRFGIPLDLPSIDMFGDEGPNDIAFYPFYMCLRLRSCFDDWG